MIKELDTIVLTIDLPEFGLHAGDLGTVVLLAAPPPPPRCEAAAFGAAERGDVQLVRNHAA